MYKSILAFFRQSPVAITFSASLLLSLVARLGCVTNRDGMLYVNTAEAYLEGGFTAAKALFGWPFLPIAMAYTSRITGLAIEDAGYLLNALFMAGACALMVACIQRKIPELAWISCLTVVALPGFNEYRNELLREFGCWFFVMLSIWLALRWDERPNWRGAFSIQIALFLAALFRPEALTLSAAVIGWQFFAKEQRWRRLTMIGTLPTLGGVILVILYLSGQLGDGRLANEFSRISLTRFNEKASVLAEGLISYAHPNAPSILLFGSLALIPIKLIQKFGLFLIPLFFFAKSRNTYQPSTFERLLWCLIGIQLCVLAIFVIDLQFLAGRYVGLLLLFSTPFAARGLHQVFTRWPLLKKPTLAMLIILALANVASTGSSKAYFVDAGRWLANHSTSSQRVYIDSGRTAYHAGWKNIPLKERNNRAVIEKAVAEKQYDLFVLEVSRKDAPIDDWLKELELTEIRRFKFNDKDAVIILTPNKQEK